MKTSHCRPPTTVERAAWGREDAQDEARWEQRLRQLPKHGIMKEVLCEAPMPTIRRILEIVDGMARHDVVLTPPTLPLIRGADAEDLVCGRCAVVIFARTNLRSARCGHPGEARLLVRCTCGSLNVLYRPAAWRGRNGWGKGLTIGRTGRIRRRSR